MMSRLPCNISLIAAISMWLLVTYVLIASASLSDRNVPLCARQPPTQLRFQEHREHYQDTFLQTAVHLTSPTPLLAADSDFSSYQTMDNETVFELLNQPATRINTTQLADSLGGLDLARGTEDSEETPTEEQHNDTSNDLTEEECPSELDTLECEDCGGPERTRETIRGDFHCMGIEAENYKWKNCYCLNWDDPDSYRPPCTFDSDSEDDSSQPDTDSDDDARNAPDSDNDTRCGSD